MEVVKPDNGLSPDQLRRIQMAQKRKSVVDPGCEKLSPEEYIKWHPVGGISWEERSRRMNAAGITDQNPALLLRAASERNPKS